MKKHIYRIELREIDSIFKDMVLEAAMSNGGTHIPLTEIASAANHLCRKYPATGSRHTVNLIGDKVLTINKVTENILVITEIEVLELIDEDAPTLSRYGITDENNMELLN